MATVIEAAHNLAFSLIANSIRDVYLERLELFRAIVERREELGYGAVAAAIAARRRRARTRGDDCTRERAGDAAAGGARVRAHGEGGTGFAVIAPREASILAALADAAAAPEPPLPPVAATDAAAAFDAWLAAAPRRNRLGLRAGLLALERASGRRRFRSLDRAGRIAVLRRLQRSRLPLVSQLAEALRAAAVVSYHGDARVMAALGYDAEARVREVRAGRARALGAAAGSDPAGRSRGSTPMASLTGSRTLRADVCVIGAGAGGAVGREGARRGAARAWSCSRRAATTPPGR